MKRKGFIILLLLLSAMAANAQTTLTGSNEKVSRSMEIARAMLKAIQAQPDGFQRFKGEQDRRDGGDIYYAAHDTDLYTSQQFVIAHAAGSTSFVATYKRKDKEDRIPILAFVAFTTGILTLPGGKEYTVENGEQDPATLDQPYYLKMKDVRMATFVYNPVLKQGVFTIN
jgi:hypothetical protein